MKSFKDYLRESALDIDKVKQLGRSLIPYDESKFADLEKWLDYFPNSGRAPKGKKREAEHIKSLKDGIKFFKEYNMMPQTVGAIFSYYDADGVSRLVDDFLSTSKKAKVEKITVGKITFINNSSMAESRFKKTVKAVADLLKRFKGYHKKAIETPLEIHFKYSKEIKSKAVYKGLLDQIWVKESSKADNELYGHLLYIIVHELGHRYEKIHKLPKGFVDNKFYTTKYSKVDGMGGSEAFAEMFAVSFWEDSYKEYSEQVERFKKLL